MQTYQAPLASQAPNLPPGIKTFPDAKSRAAAANAQFLAVANQYGMTQPGKMALYMAGVTYMDEGNNGAAEDALKKVAEQLEWRYCGARQVGTGGTLPADGPQR